jgi:hypothetical protein
MLRNQRFALFAFGMLASSACGNQDPYSQIAASCNYKVASLGQYQTNETMVKTTLTADCKAALEAVLPFDNLSFDQAPAGMKDKVMEAFQALIAYPLAIQNRAFFGVSSPDAGMISLALSRILEESSNPNQAVFNDIVNQIDLIDFDPTDQGTSAQYNEHFALKVRHMTVYNSFWNQNNMLDHFIDPFYRASTLVHEARHGDGIPHVPCASTSDVTGFNCDNEFVGAYGAGISYLHFLLQGNASCEGDKCRANIPHMNVLLAGLHMCQFARDRINKKLPELETLLKSVKCENLAYSWIMQHEGLAEALDPLPSDGTTSTGSSANPSPTPTEAPIPGLPLGAVPAPAPEPSRRSSGT